METLAERPTCTPPRQTVRPGVTAIQEETVCPLFLARSLGKVVRRHQTLRTTFTAPGGAPEPVAAPRAVSGAVGPWADLFALYEKAEEAASPGVLS
jgi:hypothetical protein